MRLQLNLNQYYEGLDNCEVNTLFRLFMIANTKCQYYRESLRERDDISEEILRIARKIGKQDICQALQAIDRFYTSLGKAPIFPEIADLDTDEKITAFDFSEVADRYEYLIREPGEESYSTN